MVKLQEIIAAPASLSFHLNICFRTDSGLHLIFAAHLIIIIVFLNE